MNAADPIPQDELAAALREYIEATLVDALVKAGRRPGPSNTTALLLVPTVVRLVSDPVVVRAIYGREVDRG